MKHSPRFKEYVWDKCIAPQLGYSFNLAHGVAYSLIGLQEINLATRFNPLYWACANLCVAAGLSTTEITDEDMEDVEEDQEDQEEVKDTEDPDKEEENAEDKKKKKSIAPNYVKIATAIANAKGQGVEVNVPDINTSERDFTPDVKNNAILYGLGAVVGVNEDLFDRIIANRPYHKVSEFIEKVEPTTVQMINLIKSGCFDNLLKQPRNVIMGAYFYYLAKQKIKEKDKLTATQLKQAIELKMDFGSEFETQVFLFNYKKYIDKNQYDAENKRYVLDDEDCKRYFRKYVEFRLDSKKDIFYLPEGKIAIKKTSFTKMYNEQIKKIMDYLNSEKGRKIFYELQIKEYINKLASKYCEGTIAAWEMETLSYYHEDHELKHINRLAYDIVNFNDLPENPDPDDYKSGTGCIAGTVIGFDNARKLVDILTPDNVVTVKFFGDNYVKYNKRLSELNPETHKKVVVEESWFKRGTKLLIFGQRRENMFLARRGGREHPMVGLIENINAMGELELRYQRKGQ